MHDGNFRLHRMDQANGAELAPARLSQLSAGNDPLETHTENIKCALIFMHGINRDADNHFRTILAAAFLADTLNDTVLIAPRFASKSGLPGNESGRCADTLAAAPPDSPKSSSRSSSSAAQ